MGGHSSSNRVNVPVARSLNITPSIIKSAGNVRIPASRCTQSIARSTNPPPLVYFNGHVDSPRQILSTSVPSSSSVQRSVNLPTDRCIKNVFSNDSIIDPGSSTEITPVKSEEELDNLDIFLGTESNMQSMIERLSSLLTTNDAVNRFSEALYIIMGAEFLTQCSWLGGGKGGPKIGLKHYGNLQNLLRLVAEKGVNSLETIDYVKLLKTKLYNAKGRLLYKGIRKSVCKLRQRKSTKVLEVDPFFDTVSITEIIPATSKEQLNRLEGFLNTENNMQSIVQRLNSLIAAEDAAKRLSDALDLVVSDDLLAQCGWLGSGRGTPTIDLKQCVNIQNLLQLVAENGVHSLEKTEFEKCLQFCMLNVEGRIRFKNIRKAVSRYENQKSNINHDTHACVRVIDCRSLTESIPVRSKEELDRLESFLNTESNMQSMANHLNSLVFAQAAANRLSEALHMVVSDEFLAQCSWLGRSKPTTGLVQCVNIQSLLLLVAENGVPSLERVEFEKILKSNIFNVKGRFRLKNIRNSIRIPNSDSVDAGSTTDVTSVKTKEELDTLEEFLSTEHNMQSMVDRIKSLLTADDVVNRLCEALYIVVNDKFLIQCSWTGSGSGGTKVALRQYVNFQNLLRLVSEDGVHSLERKEIEKILKIKLNNAKGRLHFKNIRKSACKFRKRNLNNTGIQEAHSSDRVMVIESATEISTVKSKLELDKLEEFLNAEKNMQTMVESINNLLTADDAVHRLNDALRIVVGVEFLTKFSWMDDVNGRKKIALRRYVNFQRFLQLVVENGVHNLEKAEFEKILKSTIHNAKCSLRFETMFKSKSSDDQAIESDEKISPVISKEELDELEEFLNTDNNMRGMVERLNKLISAHDVANRFSEALYIVVDDKFLTECSWTGIGSRPKLAMRRYVNLQKLLLLVAENGVHRMHRTEFESIFKSKLYNAKSRLRFRGLRKRVCKKRKKNSTTVHEINYSDTESATEITPVKSKEELDNLDIFLGTESNMQSMIERLSSLLTTNDAVNRFSEALYIIMGAEFLTQCSWLGGGKAGSKIGLQHYGNLQKLLRLVAEKGVNSLETIDYVKLLKTKLYNAKGRLLYKGIRKSVCKLRQRKTNSASFHKILPIDSVIGTGSTSKNSLETRSTKEISNSASKSKFSSATKSTKEIISAFTKSNSASIHQTQSIEPTMYAGSTLKVSSDTSSTKEILLALIKSNSAFVPKTQSIDPVMYAGSTSKISPESRSTMGIPLETRTTRQISLETRTTTKVSPDAGSNSIISDIKTKEELDTLEEFLNSENNMQSMAKRLNRLMSAQGVENRFNEALNLVVGVDFLTQCSWVGSRSSIGLQKYVNFQNLLRLLAEDSVHTLRKAELEKFFKINIYNAKHRTLIK
ncbi:uncharacterized protein LOC128301660 [Anopheles moucheti]|uniref:uncharacterized protein LOC128301660 n=1 Tax=Anopheles moucheti TaxID=186751 RepID=UPI0022F06337|nr:uncharacterized protein LOC128301660 [Anopheles moucheti]